ncbi:4a-hydroxytetrahydrobiopterin dehydratase, partial [Nocardioides sp.]|uniref:4a-hydroxytetrahydrobiopterin dehydratase n=1 Tax=Nocardioides sp. TaxID=35761 RepID=UPI00261438C1
MSDPKQKLTATEVREAGLDDWRHLLTGIRARFRTGDFATGLALVDRIGAAAEEADHHPDISLTYPEVIVTLSSHDVGGITSRDVDLARAISGFAAEAGATADVSGLTQLEPGLDTSAPEALGGFYAALLGGDVSSGEPVDPSGQVPGLWFQRSGEEASSLPPQGPAQRWHLDVWVPHDEGERRLQAVLDAGGTLVSDAEAPSFWVVADADGNRSCICTRHGRGGDVGGVGVPTGPSPVRPAWLA